jgi:elongator complex protein 3
LKEIEEDSALIRELHVYGAAAMIGEKTKGKSKTQHRGLGKALLETAEDIARTYNRKNMVIISGVGVRGYYRKLGYKKKGPYMVKKL